MGIRIRRISLDADLDSEANLDPENKKSAWKKKN